MRRREFIILLGGVAAWGAPARGQEPRRVIGFLGSGSSDKFPGSLAAFVQGLKDTGFIEGNNISIERRWADGTMVKRQAGALVVMPDPFFFVRREQLVALAARYAVPTIYPARDFTEIGGLMSYGISVTLGMDLTQQVGAYTGKILRGCKPADLPVQQSIKFDDLVINLKTAKAVGLTIPPTLLIRADVIE
jgi:ABC-type uncharacterized transport system substrate-binding protein